MVKQKIFSLDKVKGYGDLNPFQKNIFEKVYRKHQGCLNNESKVGFEPKQVAWEKGYLRVVFKNKVWLHYTTAGTWY